MAQIKLCISAIGLDFAPEICSGCKKAFYRGERRSAVVSGTDEPMGWFCDECIADWKAKGIKSRVFEANP